MHYDVDYSQLSGNRKRWKALLDCRDYCGKERFDNLRQLIRTHPPKDLEWWRLALSFTGIQGYPAIALYNSYAQKEYNGGDTPPI